MSKILIIEDDPGLGPSLKTHLQNEGYKATLTNSLESARDINLDNHDLIILDWMLPDGQGIDFLKEIRQVNKSIPIIMLTARVELIDKIVGLETGASDYLTKPFEPRELVARIRVQLRTPQQNSNDDQTIISFKDITINLTTREIINNNETVELTKMEFDLLKLLLESPNRVFPREEILNKVWGYENYPTTRTVDTHILQIRQKFSNIEIETVRGIGYRLKN